MARFGRGDIVRAKDEEGFFTAVVMQTDMLEGDTVIVCPITRYPIDVSVPIRAVLRESVTKGAMAAHVLVDKPIAIPRAWIVKRFRRATYDELIEIENALILVLGLGRRLQFYPTI